MTQSISLLNKISSIESLTKAWGKLNKSNEDSHGLSDESIKTFEKDRDDRIQSISRKLREGKYKLCLLYTSDAADE